MHVQPFLYPGRCLPLSSRLENLISLLGAAIDLHTYVDTDVDVSVLKNNKILQFYVS